MEGLPVGIRITLVAGLPWGMAWALGIGGGGVASLLTHLFIYLLTYICVDDG